MNKSLALQHAEEMLKFSRARRRRLDSAPTHLIRDRDAAYGHAVTKRLAAMGIRDHPIAPSSPWQNGHAERLIGSIRRECLDHLVGGLCFMFT
jgi:transposase InsO family protein